MAKCFLFAASGFVVVVLRYHCSSTVWDLFGVRKKSATNARFLKAAAGMAVVEAGSRGCCCGLISRHAAGLERSAIESAARGATAKNQVDSMWR